jgi:hypothetical protein
MTETYDRYKPQNAKGAFPKKDASAQSYPGTSIKLA